MNNLKFKSLHEIMKDNAIPRKSKVIIVIHWTGARSLNGTIQWLDRRLGGNGTVGYNYIIEKNGKISQLCPDYYWFHNTGLGSQFDIQTIAISFVGRNEFPTEEQYLSCKNLINDHLKDKFKIIGLYSHHELNHKKPDYPNKDWKELKKILES